MGSGHSQRASNVTYGRLEDRVVRAFDFRYEGGHGTQRVSRHYEVVVLEVDRQLPSLLMWSDHDQELAPLVTMGCDGHLVAWNFKGDRDLASVLAGARKEWADRAVSFEAGPCGLMVFSKAKRRIGSFAGDLVETVRAMALTDLLVEKSDEMN